MFSMGQSNDGSKKKTFLDDLPESESKLLLNEGELRSFPSGQTVFTLGDIIPGVYVVSKGALKITRAISRERVQVLDVILPGQCIGEAQVFTNTAAASKAEAYGETYCWLIPSDAIRRIIRENPIVSEAIIKHLAGKILHLVPLVETLSLHGVPERVAQMVLEHANKTPDTAIVEFVETQEELSHYIGCSREAFNRALRMLANLGFIQNSYPVIRILEYHKLQVFSKG